MIVFVPASWVFDSFANCNYITIINKATDEIVEAVDLLCISFS